MALTNLSQITTSGIATGTDLNIRNITGAAATFTGNVTVGGTLTYDDVTNIDSVGLVTARSGVEITGGDLTIPDSIVHRDDTNTKIRFPGNDTFTVETSGSEALRVDSDQRLFHGTIASVTANSEVRNVQIVTDTNNANQGLGVYAFTAGNNAPRLDLGSSPNGTINTFTTASSTGDLCGRINFLGSDGDEFLPTARIEGRVDGTAADGDMPGRLEFYTTANSGSSPTERLRILSTGTVNIGDQGLSSEYLSSTVKIRKDQNSVTRLSLRNENSGSGSASAIQVGAYGNSWMLQCGSAANDSNAFTIRVDGSANSNTGIERLRITTAGLVGIGTNNPSQKLDVNGDIRAVDGTAPKIIVADNFGAQRFIFGYTQSPVGHNLGSKILADGLNIGYYTRLTQNGSHIFYTNNSGSDAERLRITSAGLVGIGTNNPDKQVQIEAAEPFLRLENTHTGSKRLDLRVEADDNHAYISAPQSAQHLKLYGRSAFTIATNSETTERFRITSGGNVGIGTDNPDNLLHLSGTNTTVWPFGSDVSGVYAYSPYPHELQIQNHARDVTGAFAGIYFHSGASADGSYMSAARIAAIDSGNYRSDLAFGTRNTNFKERLRITFDGKLGVNVTSPGCQTGGIHAVHDATEGTPSFTGGEVGIFQRNYNSAQGCEIGIIGGSNSSSRINFGDKDDADIGIISYSHNDNSMRFIASAAERLRITSGGAVNIGGDYTQTLYKTQITGDLLIQKDQAAYQHPQIELYALNTGAYGGAIKFTGNLAGTKYTQATIRTYGGANTSDGSLAFFTGNGTEKLRIFSDGSVRIGDNSVSVAAVGSGPTLAINGAAPEITLRDSATNNPYAVMRTNDFGSLTLEADQGNNAANSTIHFRVDNAERMRINSTFLLYGDTASDLSGTHSSMFCGSNHAFQREGDAGTYLSIGLGAANGTVDLEADARSGGYPDMRFITTNDEQLRVLAAGHIWKKNDGALWHGTTDIDDFSGAGRSTNNRVSLRAGNPNDGTTPTNDNSAIKIYPVGTRGTTVGTLSGGIAWQHLDPSNGSWNTAYGAGSQMWMGAAIHDTPGQERDRFNLWMNSGTTGNSNPGNLAIEAYPNGMVRHPKVPAFMVRNSNNANAFTANAIATWNVTILNNGSSFSNNKFTAPVPGLYFFSCMMLSNASTRLFHDFRVNGIQVTGTRSEGHAVTNSYATLTITMVYSLNQNDYVEVYVANNNAYGGNYANFNGFLIG